ncbi:MAG: hypothetical protein WDN50_16935 [Bradyrhizobium sp.]
MQTIMEAIQKTEVDLSPAWLSASRRKLNTDPAWRAAVAISYRGEFLSPDRLVRRRNPLFLARLPFLVDIAQKAEGILVKSEPDVQSMLDVPAANVTSAGEFPAGPPA